MAIRRTDEKYTNLSAAQYNGSARPGELVIDLTTFEVFVGNNAGNLIPISSGGGNLANAIIGNLTVTGTSNLGQVGNITILGGSAGQVLTTDGTGNLSWTTSGGGSGGYGNSNVSVYLDGNIPTDIIPAANATQSLGNVTNQWLDLWLSGNTLYFNSVPLGTNAGSEIEFNGVPLVTVTGSQNIVTTGNGQFNAVTATNGNFIYISGDGSNINNIGNANYANYAGNVVESNQPNITQVGTLVTLGVAGNAAVGENLAVTGNLTVGTTLEYDTANALLKVIGTANVNQLDTDTITGVSPTIQATGVNGGITLVTSGTGNVVVSGAYITNVQDPINPQDAATKAYVDAIATGLNLKPAVNLATDAPLALPYTYNNGTAGVGAELLFTMPDGNPLVIEGQPALPGYRVLVKNEIGPFVDNTTPSSAFNGVYTVSYSSTTVGSITTYFATLTRTTDLNESSEFPSAFVFDEFSGNGWVCTNIEPPPVVVGTTEITWTQFSRAGQYTAGVALSQAGTAFNVNTDGTTVSVNASNQLEIPVNAQLNAPNIGSATGQNLTLTGNIGVANATVTGLLTASESNLGPVGNVTLLGGTAGQVITTDGTGNLSFVSIPAGYSNADVSAYLDGNIPTNIVPQGNGTQNLGSAANRWNNMWVSGTGTFQDITTANITAINRISGNGAGLSDIAGANVSGQVTFAAVANSVAGANVAGTVASATVAASANSVAGANVVGTVASATVAASANSVAGANVSGQVAFAAVANSVAAANIVGSIPSSNYAAYAGNVVIGAQPNITSVGTLSTLTVSGNASLQGIVTTVNQLRTESITGVSPTIQATGVNGNVTLRPGTTGNINASGAYITNVKNPVNPQDAVTKSYLDTFVTGFNLKDPVNLATNAALPPYVYSDGADGINATITVIMPNSGPLLIEGQPALSGYRVLIKNEIGPFINNSTPSAAFNGIYTVSYSSVVIGSITYYYTILTRTADFDAGAELARSLVVDEYSGNSWFCTNSAPPPPIVIGITEITWAQFGSGGGTQYTAGSGLQLVGTQFSTVTDGVTVAVNGSNQLSVPPNAQFVTPNIGNATGSNLTVTNTVSAANIVATGLLTASESNLGPVGNVTILGGLSGQFLQTDGAGNLTWANTGGGTANTGNITFANTTLSTAATLGNITLSTYDTANAITNNWVFSPDGNLTLPTNTSSINYANGAPFGGANITAIPAVYFVAPATGNNQTFSNSFLSAYSSNTDITLFYNGVLLDSPFYTLSGDTVTVNTPLTAGDSIDIIRQFASNVVVSTYANSNVAAYLPTYTGSLTSLTGDVTTTANISGGNLAVTGNTALGNVGNVSILGGTTGQFLQTDGTGNLAWANAGGSANIMAIPAVYFVAPTTGNNQTFSNPNLGLYATASDLTVFYNGVLLENDYYTLSGDVLTVNTIIQAGDSVDIIRQFANSVPAPAYFAIPAVYFIAPTTGNNQTFTDSTLSQYGGTDDLTVFYNGSLLEQQYYSLSGTTLTVNTLLFSGDTVDIPRQLAGNVGTITSSYNDANVLAYLSSGTFAGNIIPSGNNIFSLGNVTNQWKDLWVSNSTIYIDSVPISIAAGNVLTVGNANVVTTSPDGTTATTGVLTVTGNIVANTGYYFLGDGGLLSNINVGSDYSNANVANYLPTYLPTYTGNISAGNATVTGRVTANTVSLGAGNLSLAGNTLSTTADTITIDPLGDGTNAGNVVVAGNLTVGGTLTYNNTVVASTNDLLWIAANNAASPALATGGGLAVGPAGAYAQFTFNAASNVWQSTLPILANGGVQANGPLTATTGVFSANVTAPYFIGNGSQLTGMYGNDQVANYLPTYTGNVTAGNVVSSGNVIAARFIGDGSQLTSLPVQPGTYSNANVQAYLPTYLPTYLSTYTGNVTSGNVTVSGRTTTANLIVTGNSALGSVANVSITGGIPGQVLTTSGTGVLTWTSPAGTYANSNVASYLPTYTGNLSAGNITTTGNTTAQFFFGNGSQLTGMYANSNVASYLPTYTGNLTAGNITASGNIRANIITANFLYGDGSNITGITSYSDANVANYLPTYTGNLGNVNTIAASGNVTAANLNLAAGGAVSFGSGGNMYAIPTGGLAGTVTVNGVNDRGISLTAGGTTPGSSYSQIQWVQDINTYDPYDPAGSITNWVYTQFDGTYIENFDLLNSPGYTYSWKFGTDGQMTAAGNITTPGNISAGFFIGDGSQLTGLPAGYANSDVANYLPTYTGNLDSVGNLTVTGDTSLGPIGNVAITGGNSGEVLTTDGTGNLSWTEVGLYSVPPVYITAVSVGNNQTFSNTILASYNSNTEMTVFYNGALLENTYYTLSADTITVNIPLAIGDGIDVVTTIASNVNSIVSSGYGNSNVAAYLPQYTGNLANLAGDVTTTANVTAAKVSLGTGNLQLIGNVISTTGDTITIDPRGDGIGAGNVVVQGSLQVNGNLTYNDVVNASTNDLLWIAANNAINPAAASGGGLAVGPSGSYAQFTYNAGANAWQSSLPIIANGGVNANGALSGATTGSFSGNVTADYFIGDGSLLTNLPGGVTDKISNGTSNVEISTLNGNITMAVAGNSVGTITATRLAIGQGSGATSQGANAIAIGQNAGSATQAAQSVAIGAQAGETNQGLAAIAIGSLAGQLNQPANSIILNASNTALNGTNSGFYVNPVRNDTGNITNSVYYNATTKELTYGPVNSGSFIANGTSNISIAAANGNINIAVNGIKTGTISANSVALGYEAGNTGQGIDAVAIGPFAGTTNQGANAVAIGDGAGRTNQQTNSISIGLGSAASSQGANAVAIGAHSGGINQAANSIAIGANAQAAAASIVLNATGANLLGDVAGFYVNPVRNDTTAANTTQAVTYNTTSRELTYTNTLNLTGTVQAVNFIAGDVSNANSTRTRIAYFGANSYIQTGNGTVGSTGNIIFSPYSDATPKVVINTTTGNITANNIGNVAPINLTGNSAVFLTGFGTWETAASRSFKDISKLDHGAGYNAILLIADGRLFCLKGFGNGGAWYAALGKNQSYATQAGINNCYEITFPNEEVGTLRDAGSYGTSAYALFDSGNLYTWGYNGYGQLGLGNTTNTFLPTLSNTNVNRVYTHPSQDALIDVQRLVIEKNNNTFWGCGHDGQYQLGLGTGGNKTSWVQLTWITTASTVYNLGGDLGCLVVQQGSDNSIWVSGWNGTGALGLGSTTQPTFATPAPLWQAGDPSMTIQSAHFGSPYNDGGGRSNFMNLVLHMNNGAQSRLVGAGSNNWGNLGTGNTTNSTVPVAPLASTGMTNTTIDQVISAGSAPMTVYVLMANNDLYAYGYNSYGQVGNGSTNNAVSTPFKMTTDVIAMYGDIQGFNVLGYLSQSPLIKKSTGWFSCGYGGYGQIGNGSEDSNNTTLQRLLVPKDTSFKFVGSYGYNEGQTRIAITDDNIVWAWGFNGQACIDPGQTGWQFPVPVPFTPNALKSD